MRHLIVSLLLAPSLVFAKATLTPAKNAKVYKAGDSLTEVTVVELEPIKKGEVLLKVDKSNSAIDGIIVLHRTQVQGKAQAYVMDFEGDHTRMRANDGYWYKSYSLYLPESPTKTIDISFNANASKAVDTAKFVKEYEAQDKKAVNAKLQKAYGDDE